MSPLPSPLPLSIRQRTGSSLCSLYFYVLFVLRPVCIACETRIHAQAAHFTRHHCAR
jgi:hypothetical protein